MMKIISRSLLAIDHYLDFSSSPSSTISPPFSAQTWRKLLEKPEHIKTRFSWA